MASITSWASSRLNIVDSLGAFRPNGLDRLLQFLVEHVPIEEEQGTEGRFLGRGENLPLDGQQGEECFDFPR